MLYSYNWLNQRLSGQLPPVTKLIKSINDKAFEVEAIIDLGDDHILEIDILPNRAGDCLSHEGLARELAAILEIDFPTRNYLALAGDDSSVVVGNIDKDCRRYMAVKVEGIKINPSPTWLATGLKNLEAGVINNVVDLSNFIMLDTGQPLHAFDADKVKGKIEVRLAGEGEEFTSLDNKNYILSNQDLVIADEIGPLALAGIKGGIRAGVSEETVNLILESANFQPVRVRKTATRLSLRTDSIKRFENNPSPVLTAEALNYFITGLVALTGARKVGSIFDYYPQEEEEIKFKVDVGYLGQKLGLRLDENTVKRYLNHLGFVVSPDMEITVPWWRRDIKEPVDLVEEVGRLHGYDKLEKVLPTTFENKRRDDPLWVSIQAVRRQLALAGWNEIYSRSFTDQGKVKVANPADKTKSFLRTNLADNLTTLIKRNLNYLVFDTDPVMVFEIGTVFLAPDKEEVRLAIGLGHRKSRWHKEADVVLTEAVANLKNIWGTEEIEWQKTKTEDKITIWEGCLPKAVIDDHQSLKEAGLIKEEVKYKPLSVYPVIIRDISLWLTAGESEAEVENIVKNLAGSWLVFGPSLFDRYEKEGKVSLAYRLVFQSADKTLTDSEVNKIMSGIENKLKEQGLEIR
ncbi:MAG: phenylalanine--tRNA ligase subunit beta [Patescibacteria group bacterium]